MRPPALTLVLPCILACLCAVSVAQEAKHTLTAQDVRDMATAGEDFRGAVLSGMDLAALKVAGLDLSGTNWAKADLRGAVFSNVRLTGASLDEVTARGATFADCNMVNAMMRNGDFAGAVFQRAQLAGADLEGSLLNGAEFAGGVYSRTGGSHAGAIAAAIGAVSAGDATTPISVSAAIAAGMTGEPFAFTYNTADVTQWPMAPFTESPIAAAAHAAGYEVVTHYDLTAEKAIEALMQALRAGKVCILPLSLASEEMTGRDFLNAFWAAAVGVDETEKPARAVLSVPPFGRREYVPAELAERWAGPWPTLEPAGTERSEAKFPIAIISAGPQTRTPREMICAALQHAAQTIQEPRTYTTLMPGVAGLQRLAADFTRAAQATGDPQLLNTLAPWAGTPRQLMISARGAAADFLEEAAEFMLQTDKGGMARAAALYRGEVQILQESFPSLQATGNVTAEDLRERFTQAANIIEEIASIEATAAKVMLEVAGA